MSSESQVLRGAIGDIFARHNSTLNFSLVTSKNVKRKDSDIQFAVTVLLVDLASCDQNFDAQEYETICVGLKRLFGTTPAQVKDLVHQAKLTLGNLRGLERFANLLREHLSEDEKVKVFEVIDEVIKADGVEDGFEIFLRMKFASMLGVKIEGVGQLKIEE